ncbi:serine hydrolase FSH [Stachybotrys elegans]|uniref:Serine hydrolase FSH n=1 Tax=Stachybotrys elegans TaxID=80388 RepID=A0A8K0SCE0_9HYPO|nr:serine hydrolase FSH [Stachybotrys elegans]
MLPRVLCFHGAGSSGAIYRVQGRSIFQQLKDQFTFVFLDAPFPSDPGPGIRPVFESSGPFYSWHIPDKDNTDHLLRQITDQVQDSKGGPIVGIFAFSQGARMATGLLMYLQSNPEVELARLLDIRFMMLNSGIWPPIMLDEATSSALPGIASTHVMGKRDPWRGQSMKLYALFDVDKANMIHFEGGHQIPVGAADSRRIIDVVRKMFEA